MVTPLEERAFRMKQTRKQGLYNVFKRSPPVRVVFLFVCSLLVQSLQKRFQRPRREPRFLDLDSYGFCSPFLRDFPPL